MKIKIFQYESGNYVRKGHNGRISSVCYHKEDKNLLVSGGWDKEIFFYDIRDSNFLIN
jgi:WD40 repeat protein